MIMNLINMMVSLFVTLNVFNMNFNYDFMLEKVESYHLIDYVDYLCWRHDMIEEYGLEEYVEINKFNHLDSETESFIDYQLYIKEN